MWLNPVLAKLLTLRVIKNSLRRTGDIKMFQRKEILRHVRSLSVLRKIRASWNVIIVAIKVTLLVSVLRQSRFRPY